MFSGESRKSIVQSKNDFRLTEMKIIFVKLHSFLQHLSK